MIEWRNLAMELADEFSVELVSVAPETAQQEYDAIHKSIQSIEEKLNFYEEKLKLYKKNTLIRDIIKITEDKKIKELLEQLQ